MRTKACGVEVELTASLVGAPGTLVLYGQEELGWIVPKDANGFWGAHSWWGKDGSLDPSSSANAGMHGSRKAATEAIVVRAIALGKVKP